VALKESGLSLTDVVGLKAGLLINGFVTTISLQLLAAKTTQLTELFKRLSEVNALLKIDDIQINQIASCKILINSFILFM
jgi:hypothetical protein